MRLFIDDERDPIQALQPLLSNGNPLYLEKWDVARNYDQFVKFIELNGIPDVISFDNDLGEEFEGYDCAKFLVNYCIEKDLNLPTWMVHSGNSVARENINTILNRYNKFRTDEHTI